MKKLFSLLMICGLITTAPLAAQEDMSERKSPPAKVTQKVGDATVSIHYSQPSVNDREIFGGLVPFGKIWRTGANEATTFETDKDLMINGKKLPAGKYALFTIPGEDSWTIIFNSEHEQWGAYKYNQKKDVLRLEVKPEAGEKTEQMTFVITKEGVVQLNWDQTQVPFRIKA